MMQYQVYQMYGNSWPARDHGGCVTSQVPRRHPEVERGDAIGRMACNTNPHGGNRIRLERSISI